MLRLRVLAREESDVALSRQVSAEVREATNAILVEANAAAGATGSARREPQTETFMLVRLNRLATAADEAVNAARSGDGPQLRRQLSRFNTLTSALWTVQNAVYGPGAAANAVTATPGTVRDRQRREADSA
jgi:hypothetical protein